MHRVHVTSYLETLSKLHPRQWRSAPKEQRGPPRVAGRAPGSDGEHRLQAEFDTRERAGRFYSDQLRDHLVPTMIEFVGRMDMVFVATSDGRGECDASLRAGPPGFLRVLDDRTMAYPEYRGNGVLASLGNISENPHIGLLMIDFVEDMIGLHVNGHARIVDDKRFREQHPDIDDGDDREGARGRRAERWVLVDVTEAYIHCRKHIPRMQRLHQKRDWGTDDPARKGGDYFRARPLSHSSSTGSHG
jgi:predicted pyridoxine 5'-phosphate oxidase superfamily flavin-nucleotide-binding protein